MNEDRVRRGVDRLRREYGDAPVERDDQPFEAPTDLFRAYLAAARRGTIDSSYVWVRRRPDQFPPRTGSLADESAPSTVRVLFVYDRADDHCWTIPGGGLEQGESFEEAAHRELAEETGIQASITGVRKLRHEVAVPAENEGEFDADEVHALYPVFEAEYEAGTIEVQSEELYGAAWFDRVPENRHRLVADESIDRR